MIPMTLLLTIDEAVAQWGALIARDGAPIARLIPIGSETARENVNSATEALPKP